MKWLVVVVACVGCKGKESSSSSAHATGDVVGELAASHTPSLVGAFASIRVRPELVARDVPAKLCAREASVAAWCEYTDDRYPGATWRIERLVWSDVQDKRGWPIGRLRVTVPGPIDAVRAKLEAAWGAPTVARGVAYWFDPAAHLRAALHGAQSHGDAPELVDIDLATYMPLAELVGSDKLLFGFERGVTLLGARGKDVRARYGARVGMGEIMLPPVDTAERPAIVHLGGLLEQDVPDVVTGYTIEAGLPIATLAKALEAKFGAPETDDEGDDVYHRKPDVVLFTDKILVGEHDAEW